MIGKVTHVHPHERNILTCYCSLKRAHVLYSDIKNTWRTWYNSKKVNTKLCSPNKAAGNMSTRLVLRTPSACFTQTNDWRCHRYVLRLTFSYVSRCVDKDIHERFDTLKEFVCVCVSCVYFSESVHVEHNG